MFGSTASLILLATFSTATTAIRWENLFVAFGDARGLSRMPVTRDQLEKNGYILVDRDVDLNVDFYSNEEGYQVAVGVDSYGNTAGVRIYYAKSDLGRKASENGLSFNYSYYENNPMYSSGADAYYNTILFTHPDTLKAGGRPGTNVGVGKDLFVKLKGEWTKMPNYECKFNIPFSQGLCFPIIGKHYIYGFSPNMDCMDFNGLMVMYEAGDLMGFGFAAFGSTPSSRARSWVNNKLSSIGSKIIPDISKLIPGKKPACLTKWINSYGITTVHFFFSKDPLNLVCSGKQTIC